MMKVQQIGSRSLVFTYPVAEWNLNLHVIKGGKYNYVIDTGLGPESCAPLMEHLNGGKPVIVINTHFHWDHVWGNSAFPGAMIIAHRQCAGLIKSRWDDMAKKNKRYAAGELRMRLPDVTFEGSLYFEEDGITLLHTPGHTPDSISVFDERDRVLNAGDNIGDSPDDIIPSLDCAKEEYEKTLGIYRRMDFDACVSGHNDVQGGNIAERILAALDTAENI